MNDAPRALSAMFWIAALPLLAVPAIYLTIPAGELPHMQLFAKLMIWGHPYMAPLILAGLLACGVYAVRRRCGAKSAFVASFALFAVGGVLGYMIQGVNVVIPAHYHGSTVGVTLAFMGLAYVLLPQLGYGDVDGRHGALAALCLWRRPTDPHPRPGLVGRLWRAAQGGRRRAGADHAAAEDRHGHDGRRRPDRGDRRHHVRAGAGVPATAFRSSRSRALPCCV
jgi:hypothetical protein